MKLDIKQEYYFPTHFRFFGLLLVIFSILFFTESQYFIAVKLVVSIPILILGIVIIFLRYGLIVDRENNQYMIYTSLLGYTFGTYDKLGEIQDIFIKKVNKEITYTSLSGSTHDYKKYRYKAFIKAENDELIDLDSDKNLSKLEERVNHYKNVLMKTHTNSF